MSSPLGLQNSKASISLPGGWLLSLYVCVWFPAVLGFLLLWRHHDHGNSYKGKHLFGAGLQFQRFRLLSSWWEAWQQAGRQTETVLKSSEEFCIQVHMQQEERDWAWNGLWKPGSPPPVTHFSNKAIPPNHFLWCSSMLTCYSNPWAIVIQTTTVLKFLNCFLLIKFKMYY